MRSKLETAFVWALLVLFWLQIKAPLRVFCLAVDVVVLTLKRLREAWRDFRLDIEMTREIADL